MISNWWFAVRYRHHLKLVLQGKQAHSCVARTPEQNLIALAILDEEWQMGVAS